MIPATLETTQYRANPAGKLSVKNPNIKGIAQSIILLVWACRASIDGIVVIFCIKNMERPTKSARVGPVSGAPISVSHKKELSIGIALLTLSSHE